MRISDWRWVAIWTGLAAIGLQGCSSLEASAFRPNEPANVRLRAAKDIGIVAAKHPNPMGYLNVNGKLVPFDRDQYSEELAEQLRIAINSRGGPREVRVRVDHIDYLFQGPCILDYRVEFGDGVSFGGQTKGDSANLGRGCRLAYQLAVEEIARDDRFAAFVERDYQ